MKQKLKKAYQKDGQDRLLSRISLLAFDRSRLAAVLWLCLAVFGVLSYTTFLKREGFPSVNIPFSLMSGAYFVNDPAKVDQQVAAPVSDILLKDSRVKSVQTQSRATFYAITVQYNEGVNADNASRDLERRIKQANVLPAQATFKSEAPKFGFTERGDDGVITVYATQKDTSKAALTNEAKKVANYLQSKHFSSIETLSVVDSSVEGKDATTGAVVTSQTKFDRYGVREGNSNNFYQSAAIGYMQKDGSDVIKLDDHLQEAVAAYNNQHKDSDFKAVVTAGYAHDIKDQISELQRALLEGLLAVLVVGSIVIAIRASFVTVLAMLTVLAVTIAVLFVVGYTLNTITLFSLILCMGLIVDDTIIMIEAIDAQRRRRKDARETVQVATRKVSRAMVAATLTAALSFAPLLFVGGILGGFIRAIPITVITSLLVSLCVALIFIPLFARYLLLGKKQMGAKNVHEPAARIEARVATFIGRPMLWARHSKAKLFSVGFAAVFIGLVFIGAGGYLFQKVTFNIFPPTKDSNGLSLTLRFAPGTTVEQAEVIGDKANAILGKTLGNNFRYASNYANAGAQNSMLMVYITPYTERDIRAPELVTQLESKFKNFDDAQVKVGQLDVGPPAASFNVRIQTADRQAALALAGDMNKFLTGKKLVRASGEKALITETTVADPGVYARADGKAYVEVSANFDGTDTSTLVNLAKTAVEKEFTATKIGSYGLPKDVLKFDLGQEQENQDSFKTLALAFPILLFAIYILLSVQFRSLAQPLLIFMAIPFSLFGITLGLYLTDNPFSFFAMLGFFALIGLSIKNTILLTDYANQLRRDGAQAVDAAVGALAERFRPLIATSLTAVVSLIPLALASPFWEGLTAVLIFGLLSSTFLVIIVFPYYYLGAEYLRLRVSRKACLTWLGLTILLCVIAFKASLPVALPFIPFAVLLGMVIGHKLRTSRRKP